MSYDESRETTFVNPNPKGYEIAATSEFYSPEQDETSVARYPTDITNEETIRPGTVTSSIKRNLQQTQYDQFSTENFNIENVDSDVLKQIKSQLDDLTQSIDARLKSEKYDAGKIGQTHNSLLVSRDSSSEYQATPTKGWLAPSHENESYSDNKSYTQAKYNEYYFAGENLLKAGKYYEAADSFATAAIYKPDSASCSAGQGHALFATGQYISSALFLIRAIELEPEYIQADINLVEIVGGNTKLEKKITELQQLIKNNPAAGLRFLLGYVYFKTDRIIEAKQITNSLYQDMLKSPAALSLKIAVDLKLKNQ
jgi:tetratricopeptide (TPR) repeat protein